MNDIVCDGDGNGDGNEDGNGDGDRNGDDNNNDLFVLNHEHHNDKLTEQPCNSFLDTSGLSQ